MPSREVRAHRFPCRHCLVRRANGQSTAHTKQKLAYFLAQNRSVNCSCIEPLSSTPLSLLFFLGGGFALSPSAASPSLYFSVILLHFHSPPSNHSVFIRRPLCEHRGRTLSGRWGPGMCLAGCTMGTRLSVSNDAFIINTLEPGCCTEWEYQRYVHFCGLSFRLSVFLYRRLRLPFLSQPFLLRFFFWSFLHFCIFYCPRANFLVIVPCFPSLVFHFLNSLPDPQRHAPVPLTLPISGFTTRSWSIFLLLIAGIKRVAGCAISILCSQDPYPPIWHNKKIPREQRDTNPS